MYILTNFLEFAVPQEELVNIYSLYIRSVVEQSCIVWHSSLTTGEKFDLERMALREAFNNKKLRPGRRRCRVYDCRLTSNHGPEQPIEMCNKCYCSLIYVQSSLFAFMCFLSTKSFIISPYTITIIISRLYF